MKIFAKSGIYKIQSISIPTRFYIGSAGTLNNRYHLHFRQLRENRHHSAKLQRHYNKYGESDLVFSIILECRVEDLIKEEQKYLDLYKPYFNCSYVANSCRGVKRSNETKRKISEAHKGIATHCMKHTEESRQKMSEAKKGKRPSEEARRKMSLSRMGNKNGVGNTNKRGKKLSEESKHRISMAKTGKKMDDATKRKISEANRGKKRTKESRDNISRGRTGLKMSEETKKKLSDYRKGTKLINNKYIKYETAA